MHSVAATRSMALIVRATSNSSSSSSARSVRASRTMSPPSSLAKFSTSLSPTSTSSPSLSLLRRPNSTSSRILRSNSHYARRQQHVRCFASRKEEDKSWGEIAGDAAEVAKGALKKLGVGALTAIEKVLGGAGGEESRPTQRRRESSSYSPERQRRRQENPLSDLGLGGGPGGGGGLLGNVVGSVLGKAVQGAFGAIADQAREASALADAALEAANADDNVRAEFGGRLSKAGGSGFGSMAQSSSTVVVNGRARRDTVVSFPVVGPSGGGGGGGGGFLEARARDGETVAVRVRTPRGRVVDVGSGGGGGGGGGRGGGGGGSASGSGDVIDVDFREVN